MYIMQATVNWNPKQIAKEMLWTHVIMYSAVWLFLPSLQIYIYTSVKSRDSWNVEFESTSSSDDDDNNNDEGNGDEDYDCDE